MSYPIRVLVVLLTFFLSSPVGAEEKPAAKPGDARRATLVRAGYTPVPLALDPDVLVFFAEGVVGGEKVRYFVDSGATNVFLDVKLARRLKLKLGALGAQGETTGPDGPVVGRPTFVPGLKIGSYDTRKDWPQVFSVASDLSRFAGSSCVLGEPALDAWAAVVDYPARTLYLRSPLTTAWPRLAGTWKVTSWHEDGAARKLDSKAPPPAFVTVRVPSADAEVWFDGQRTQHTGVERFFESPPLEPGKYSYEIRAKWRQDGKDVEQTRTVEVQPGQRVTLDFKREAGRADEKDDWTGEWVLPRKNKVPFRDRDGKPLGAVFASAGKVLSTEKTLLHVRSSQGRGPHDGFVSKTDVVKLADAEAFFSNALRADGKSTWARRLRGQARLVKKEYDSAIRDFTEAIRLDPKDASAFLPAERHRPTRWISTRRSRISTRPSGSTRKMPTLSCAAAMPGLSRETSTRRSRISTRPSDSTRRALSHSVRADSRGPNGGSSARL